MQSLFSRTCVKLRVKRRRDLLEALRSLAMEKRRETITQGLGSRVSSHGGLVSRLTRGIVGVAAYCMAYGSFFAVARRILEL